MRTLIGAVRSDRGPIESIPLGELDVDGVATQPGYGSTVFINITL
jgi:hypothetical protein